MKKEETISNLKAYLDGDTAIGNIIPLRSVLESALEYLKPSLPSNLNEAANNYGVDIRLGYPRVMDETDRYIYNAFKAGAEWMAGQGVSEEFDVEDGMLPCFDSRLLGLNTIACAPTVLQCKDDDVVIMQLRKK